MTTAGLVGLSDLLRHQREELLARWRNYLQRMACARNLDIRSLNNHIPFLIEELVEALEAGGDGTILEVTGNGSAPSHGLQRLQDDFDIEEIVAEYNLLRCCIHELADEHAVDLRGQPVHILNRVFDHAIGVALTTYTTKRALDIQRRREEYLAFVAHDLRTPLNAISLAGRVLELTLPARNSGPTVQMFKALRRNVRHLENLVSKVLEENSNLQTEAGITLERREFDLWPFVEALVHDLKPVAGTASTALRNDVPDDLVVYADASLLKRVFQNLIANAIKYTPRGEIRITAETSNADGEVLCSVADNGAGIPAESLDKVFDAGECDPGSEGAMGLGLAIVKMFTQAHGGEVSVESQEGIGSVFRFTIPGKVSAKADPSTSPG
jgi:two-component system, OmpR family, phosphate regulon sensor histidine kinase PhoR